MLVERRMHCGEESWTSWDMKKHSIGQNVVGGGGIVAAVVGEVAVDGEGILAWVGLLLRLLALTVILVFFLVVVEGDSGGGAGDELALG